MILPRYLETSEFFRGFICFLSPFHLHSFGRFTPGHNIFFLDLTPDPRIQEQIRNFYPTADHDNQ